MESLKLYHPTHDVTNRAGTRIPKRKFVLNLQIVNSEIGFIWFNRTHFGYIFNKNVLNLQKKLE
jgi:hypothetical protein